MTELKPYAYYAQIGDDAAYGRWNKWLPWIGAVCIAVGVFLGIQIGKNVEYAVFGAVVGGFGGFLIFRVIVYMSSAQTADSLYRLDWCQARGMTYQSSGTCPANAPYASSGDKRKTEDLYSGQWNGLDVLFYNFTYTNVSRDSNGNRSETDHKYRVMRLTGQTLPILRLSIHRRNVLNRFKWVDNIQGKLTPERPISLESAEFNQKFDLTINDSADNIWIRRIFDPATIQALVDGSFTIPDLKYYDGAWWFVEGDHFQTRELEGWVPKLQQATGAVALLARIQDL